MSSTSSSECVCGECFNCGPGLSSPGFRPRAPYYQTLAHPLVYYAQVQPNPNHKRSRHSRQDSPNCFVKAFRWYTQERHPPQNRELPNDRTDLNGFAVWLDKKYDEFMLDKRAEQNVFQVQPQRTTSTLETNQNSTSVVCDLRIKKKFARVRSPWRKRRRPGNSKEGGDVLAKCQQSFEFIMKPKVLSRQASECCHQAPHNRSNISTETQASKKTIIKSQSSNRIDHEMCNCTPIEVINIEGNSPKVSKPKSEIQINPEPLTKEIKEELCHCPPLTKEIKEEICQCPEEQIETIEAVVQCTIVDRDELIVSPLSDCDKNTNVRRENRDLAELSESPAKVRDEDGSKPKKCRADPLYNTTDPETDISCQCSKIVLVKRDAQSQYVRDLTDAVCCCSISYDFKASSSLQNHPRIVFPASIKCPKQLEQQVPLEIKDAEIDTVEATPENDLISFASEQAQTSDHSICLDNTTYPLFMKIVCADKLNEEFIRK